MQARNSQQSNCALNHILEILNATSNAPRLITPRVDTENNNVTTGLPTNYPTLVRQLDLIAGVIKDDVGPQSLNLRL